MLKILITSGTTAIAIKVKNLLSDNYIIALGTAGDIPSVLKDQYLKLPQPLSSSFVHEILKIALDNSIDVILPLGAEEIIKLSKGQVLFEEYNIKILAPDAEMVPEINTINTLLKSLDLVLLDKGLDLISGNMHDFSFSGLGLVSDSGDDFMLIAL